MRDNIGKFHRLSDSVFESLSEIYVESDLEENEFYRLIGVWFGQDFIDIYKEWLEED